MGESKPNINIDTDLPADTIYTRYLNEKYYELTDHLGNVRAVLGDRKLTSTRGAGNYFADIRSYNHPYPFGMPEPGRYWDRSSDTLYRYGYNGMETDGEVKGERGNHYTTYFRQYDPRLGRWWSNDPITHAGESPYAAMFNNPISFSDPFGNEPGGVDGGGESDPLNPPEVGCSECEQTFPNPFIGQSYWTSEGWNYQFDGFVWRHVERSDFVVVNGENPNLPSLVTTDRADLEQYLEQHYPNELARNLVRQSLTRLDVDAILFDVGYGNVNRNLSDFANVQPSTESNQNYYEDYYTYPGKPRHGEIDAPVISALVDDLLSTYTIAIFGLDIDGYPATTREVADARNALNSPSTAGGGIGAKGGRAARRTSVARRLTKGRMSRILVPGGGLAAHEAMEGSHGLLKHVGMLVDDLIAGFATEPGLITSSTFHSMGHAESSIARVLAENDQMIQDWLNNTTRTRPLPVLRTTFARSIGTKVPRATMVAEDAYSVQVIIEREPRMSCGYEIVTFFVD